MNMPYDAWEKNNLSREILLPVPHANSQHLLIIRALKQQQIRRDRQIVYNN